MFTSAIGLGELLEKPEGAEMQTDAPMESYTIVCKNRSFGRVVRFSYESVSDSKKMGNLVTETVGTWSRQIPITKDKFYVRFFNEGTSTGSLFNNSITSVVTDPSGNAIYDGKAFFATDHPDKVGNTYSNYNSSYALTYGNLQTVYTQYTTTNNKDERGDIIDLIPDTILIPPALKFTAAAILESTLIPGSTDNDVNVLKSILTPLEWPRLSDTDGWFIGKLKMGLMATDREDVSLDFFQDDLSKDYFASVFTRFGGCVSNWRYWIANAV